MIIYPYRVIFNPYNPYNPDDDKTKQEEKLKIDSLDDLFETDDSFNEEENKLKEPVKVGGNSEEYKASSSQKEYTQSEEIDLQKELEAKFDEFFGPIDDED